MCISFEDLVSPSRLIRRSAEGERPNMGTFSQDLFLKVFVRSLVRTIGVMFKPLHVNFVSSLVAKRG